MFLRKTNRRKNGKVHTYWSVVESVRLSSGRVVQRHLHYLGEMSAAQIESWRKAVEPNRPEVETADLPNLIVETQTSPRANEDLIPLHLSEMRLRRPRQWGACWLAGLLWSELRLDRFWAERLPKNRKGTRWDLVLQTLVTYRLIDPGSEWRLHRQWFLDSAMADLLGGDFALAEAHKLYACHDLLLEHKQELFSHLTERWRDLFNVDFDVLLYDLTSTYFEVNAADLPEDTKRRHGYSRDKRPDCPQLVIALVVTPDGLPLAYEVLPGNTADSKTLRTFPGEDREAVRQGAPRLGHGSRRAHRSGSRRNARQRSAGAISGRDARRAGSTGWRSISSTSPGERRARASKSSCSPKDDELYVFAQSADRVEQGARDAPAAIEVAVGAFEEARRR